MPSYLSARIQRIEAALAPQQRGPVIVHVPNGSTLEAQLTALGITRDRRTVYLGLDDADVRA